MRICSARAVYVGLREEDYVDPNPIVSRRALHRNRFREQTHASFRGAIARKPAEAVALRGPLGRSAPGDLIVAIGAGQYAEIRFGRRITSAAGYASGRAPKPY
jgi:hypothetical protein